MEKRPNETTRTIYETGPRPALRRAALHRRSGLRAFLLRAGAIRPVRRKAPRAVYFPGQLHAVQRPADPRLRGDYALSLSSKEDCEEASRWAGEVLDSRHAFQRSSLTDAQRLTYDVVEDYLELTRLTDDYYYLDNSCRGSFTGF